MAGSNSVTVEIKDGVSKTIASNIDTIAKSAKNSQSAVEKLQSALGVLTNSKVDQLNRSLGQSSKSLNDLTNSQSKHNASVQRAISAQQQLSNETARTSRQQSDLSRSLGASSNSSSTAAAGFIGLTKNFISLAAAAVAAKTALEYATDYTTITNKIKTVTDSIGQQELLLKRLTATSYETSTSLSTVTQAFIRFDRPMKQMGKTQEDTIRLITTVNKELSNTGATTAEAASAVLQLGQAFGSGKLQGDEFRAISETMPTLLDAIAKSLNVNISQVKQLGSDGKITSAVLLKALTDMAVKTDATYAKTAQTVPQAMQNVKTALTITIGEMDKALGVTANLAKGLNWLSQNMDTVKFTVTVLGAALLAAFGSTIILNGVNLLTGAFVRLSVAIASNPIGLIAVALSAAVAAVVFFGDKIKVTSDGLVTLQDIGVAVWNKIKEYAQIAGDLVSKVWGGLIDYLNLITNGWGEQFRQVTSLVGGLLKNLANYFIASIGTAYETIKLIWNNFPAFIDLVFTNVVNLAAKAVENIVNFWQVGFRKVASYASNMSPEIGGAMTKALDSVTFELPRAKTSAAGAKIGQDISSAAKRAFSIDYVGNVGDAILNDARKISKARRTESTAQLRGAGENTIIPTEKAKKQKKAKTPKEKLTDEQKAYKKALDEIKKPQLDFDAAVKVANDLLANGVINQAKYNALIMKATDTYMQAIDPMYSFNKATIEQYNALQKVGVAYQAENAVMQVRNQALQAGLPFTEQMADRIREVTDALDMQQRKHDVLNDIYDSTIGKQRTLTAQQLAYNQALNSGALSTEQYSIKMSQLKTQQAALNLQMGSTSAIDVVTAGLSNVVANYQGVASGLSDIWGSFFDTFSSGFADSIGKAIVYGDSLRESLSEVAKQALSEIISGLVKLGIQYLVNMAIANSSLAATTAANAAAGAATAAAWSPAAAMVSLASFGANAIPANLGIASTVALTQGLSMISGFKTGGYTGDGGVNDVAGVVHGKEFVMNANATARYRQMLENLNNGGSVETSSRNASNNVGSGGNVNVNVQNYGTSKNFEVQQLSEGDIRIIARDEADRSVNKNAGSVIGREFANANSDPSKALSKNTSSQRKRQ